MDFIPFAIFIFIITSKSDRKLVSSASIPQMGNSQATEYVTDANERELENLKDRLDKTLEMVKTQSSELSQSNGQIQTFTDKKETINQDGELVASVQQRIESKSEDFNQRPMARIQTDLEIPSEGVHKSVVQEIPPQRTQKTLKKKASGNEVLNKENEVQSLPGIQYTPFDMAEYIFWTGDEKGVTSAVEEFINERLISRQDAISFLQEIKNNLDYLESRYNQLGLNLQEKYKAIENTSPRYSSNLNFQKGRSANSNYDQQIFDFQKIKREERKSATDEFSGYEVNDDDPKQNEYEQLLEKLKIADFLYTEYSLEEIIYQLAKIMFKQSLTKDNIEAQQAFHKFIIFLESEAEQGHISRALEKKVLDVLISALTDTLTQNPELVDKVKETSQNAYTEKQEVLQKILELNSEANINIPTLKYSTDKSSNSNLKYPPLGYGKYSGSS
ncbi:uncharacterized protein LOC108744005 [Agrilus planipennis]|uniref:Uncharacterized protein LOC108744005 n=1 Tax=Agrilus planipennis TaxID=224129 RepID=A0A1W4XRK9_AGRPL|nr:uncharacterized protein LOC108744005 [Agrilus planipennis]